MSILLRDDGTVHLNLEDGDYETIVIPRPKTKDYKWLCGELSAVESKALALQIRVMHINVDPNGTEDEQLSQLREVTQSQFQGEIDIVDLWGNLTVSLIERMTKRVVNPDELEPSMATAEFFAGLRDHWRYVPLARGERDQLVRAAFPTSQE